MMLMLVCFACVATSTVTALAADPPVTVLSVLRDFSKQTPSDPAPAIVKWDWPEDVKKQASTFSQSQIIDHEGRRALSLTVTDQMHWGTSESLRAMPVGPDLLPPTADAVVIRYRALEGKVTLSLGGPTIYFGHSDVLTRAFVLNAEQGTGWREITVSLHDGLIRNFRRAGFGRASPVIYYTRWIQEPMGLYVHRGSVGKVLIESITLISHGRGKAADNLGSWGGESTRNSSLEDSKIQSINWITGFAEPASLQQVFTATHESADFQGPAKLSRPNWTPPKISLIANPSENDGRLGVLRIEHRAAEEVTFTGIKLSTGVRKEKKIERPLRERSATGLREVAPELRDMYESMLEDNEAIERKLDREPSREFELPANNAIALDLRVTSPLPIEQVSIDWLLYESPVDAPLDFERCRPPAEWRDKPDRAFDFYLTEKLLKGESYAMHHTRRALPNGQWTRVILPLSDFVCVFGSGTMADKHAKQQHPQRDTATALLFTPSFRQNRQPTTIEIDRIQWVGRDPIEPGRGRLNSVVSVRTFPHVDPAKVRLVPFGSDGVLRQMLPAE